MYAQPYTCGLSDACKLLSGAKHSQAPDGCRIRAVAALSTVPFARIVILTQRGISQLLLTMKEEQINIAAKELPSQTFSLPHHCALLLPFNLFILILLRVLGQTFCEDEINSLLQNSFLNSVFL